MDDNTCRWGTIWDNRYGRASGHGTFLLALALVALAMAPWARAGAAEPRTQILPSTVQFSSAVPVRVYVLVRNTTTDTVYENVTVSVPDVPDDDPDLRIEYPQETQTLEPGYEHAYELRLWPRRAEPITRTVHPRVDYSSRNRARNSGAPHVEFMTLEVKTREPAPSDKVASLEIQTTLEGLQEHRPGKLYLVITNRLGDALNIQRIGWHKPDFIRLGQYRPNCESPASPAVPENKHEDLRFCEWKELTESQHGGPISVAPHQSLTVELDAEAIGQVQPGKHLLLFDVQFGAPGGLARNQVVSRAVDVSVMGESEILKALGIPTLLLLPGFLVMVSAAVMWRWKRLRLESDPSTFPFAYTSPEFITAGITCSLLIAASFELLSQRDYLRTYGLADIMWTWATSLGLGAGGCAVGMLLRKEAFRARTPSPEDDPETTLKKLAKRGMGLRLQTQDVKLGTESRLAFLLEPIPADAAQLFCVSPAIRIKAPMELKLQSNLKACLTENDGEGNPKSLLKLLRKHRGQVTLEWDPSTGPAAISRIKADQLGAHRSRLHIVSFD